MSCTLLIPHLWWPRDAGKEAYRDLAVPVLGTCLARATRRIFPAIGWEAWLCQAFEVERQHDWPIAPVALTLDGGDPGNAYWLRADPVHLRAHRDQLLLADSSAFNLSECESHSLIQALNGHFQAEGLHFTAPCPERWYLRLDTDPQIATAMLDDVAGMPVDAHLPSGTRALHWHGFMNEVQMLLHDDPVNEAREARGELPVNGVWLWGGGRRPAVPGRHFQAVTANDALALALAANADIPATPLADDADAWLRQLGMDKETSQLIVLNQLTAPAHRGDLGAWREAVVALERRWIAPLAAALKQGRLGELVLVAPGNRGCARFELTRPRLFQFWRSRRPLASYLPA